MLTWFDASATLKDGDRVRFVLPWDIFPETIVPAGTTGVVIENSLNEMQPTLIVLPDDEAIRAKLKEWDGQIWLYGPDGDNPDNWKTECHVQPEANP